MSAHGVAAGGVTSRNPSAWSERAPLLDLASLGLVCAILLSLAQLYVTPSVFDPIFGGASSEAVLHSVLERIIPIPDAVLGIFGYLADLLLGGLGGLGGTDRWRTMPWLTLAFGAVITALALVGTLLFLLQLCVIHHWCALCLASATFSLIIYALGIAEPLASVRYLWRVYWRDGDLAGAFWGRHVVGS